MVAALPLSKAIRFAQIWSVLEDEARVTDWFADTEVTRHIGDRWLTGVERRDRYLLFHDGQSVIYKDNEDAGVCQPHVGLPALSACLSRQGIVSLAGGLLSRRGRV